MIALHGVVVVLLILTTVGCGSSSDDDATATTATTVSGETMTPAPADTVLTGHLDWLLGVLNGAEVTEATFTERFAASFVAAVPYPAFVQATASVVAAGPFTLDSADPIPDVPGGLEAIIVGADGTRLRIDLEVDDDGRLAGALISPADLPTLDDPPTDLAQAVERLRAIGATGLVAATVDGVTCSSIEGEAADDLVPIASAFKLYVLVAVADAIADGSRAWDDQLTITADVKSLPSGVLQTRDDGDTVTVRDAASLMIQISDNTATDLLLRAVGRDAVEGAQARAGHGSPAVNVPFPTTRELFLLKSDPALVARWTDGDEAARRDLLEELAGRSIAEVDVTLFDSGPIAPDTVEWFASPLDLCRVMATLVDLADQPGLEPLTEILTTNPGLPAAPGRWDRIAFKGGSEPGLVTTVWLVERDGRRFVLAGSVLDPTAEIDADEAVLLMGAARDLIPG